MNQILSEVRSAAIRDVCTDMFADELAQKLSAEETDALVKALQTAERREKPYGGYLFYALELTGEDGTVLLTLYVDKASAIETSNGARYQRAGALQEVLSSLEQTYELRKQLYHRKPGKNYFAMIERTDHGLLYELTENNFIKGLSLELGKDDAAKLALALKDAEYGDTAEKEINKKYILTLYSEGGGLLYEIYFDVEGKAYSLEGYEILCEGLQEWFAEKIAE